MREDYIAWPQTEEVPQNLALCLLSVPGGSRAWWPNAMSPDALGWRSENLVIRMGGPRPVR